MLPRWAQSGKLWVHPIPHPGRNNGGAEIRAGRPQTPLARIQAPSSVALNRTWWIPAHPELRYLHWPRVIHLFYGTGMVRLQRSGLPVLPFTLVSGTCLPQSNS